MAEDDGWQDVSVRASLLPEDMQGVFMMIARAAKEGWPCPGDAAIARAYGSHSLRLARRLLTYIEEQGLIVCRLDGAGRRIVTLVELAGRRHRATPTPRNCRRRKAAAVRLHDATVERTRGKYYASSRGCLQQWTATGLLSSDAQMRYLILAPVRCTLCASGVRDHINLCPTTLRPKAGRRGPAWPRGTGGSAAGSRGRARDS